MASLSRACAAAGRGRKAGGRGRGAFSKKESSVLDRMSKNTSKSDIQGHLDSLVADCRTNPELLLACRGLQAKYKRGKTKSVLPSGVRTLESVPDWLARLCMGEMVPQVDASMWANIGPSDVKSLYVWLMRGNAQHRVPELGMEVDAFIEWSKGFMIAELASSFTDEDFENYEVDWNFNKGPYRLVLPREDPSLVEDDDVITHIEVVETGEKFQIATGFTFPFEDAGNIWQILHNLSLSSALLKNTVTGKSQDLASMKLESDGLAQISLDTPRKRPRLAGKMNSPAGTTSGKASAATVTSDNVGASKDIPGKASLGNVLDATAKVNATGAKHGKYVVATALASCKAVSAPPSGGGAPELDGLLD